MKMLMFADLAYEPQDYLFANYANAALPSEPFRKELFVSIMAGNTRRLLRGNTLTEQTDGPKTVLAEGIERSRLTGILKEYFGIEYPISF